MDWKSIINTIAPTVASALGGPLAGAAVSAIGSVLGMSDATQDKIKTAIESGQLTGEQVSQLRQLEMKYKAEESERGFRYSELEFKDRDSARNMAIQTGSKTPSVLTWMIVAIVLCLEGYILFEGIPKELSEIVLGRILGTLDTSLALVLAYWFGSSRGSDVKTQIMAQKGAA